MERPGDRRSGSSDRIGPHAEHTGRVFRPPAVALVLLCCTVGVTGTAIADAVFITGSPGPNSTVGSVVDRVEIVFDETVTEASVAVDGPEGRVDTDMIQPVGRVIVGRFAPLSVEGRYIVRFRVTSADTDPVEGAYSFTYNTEAPAPLSAVGSALRSGGRRNPWLRVGAAIVGVAVAAVATQTLIRARRLRNHQPPSGPTL